MSASKPDFLKRDFLNLRTKPGRVNCLEASWILGFAEHDIPILVLGGFLHPLGSPPPNAVKYFCPIELEARRPDPGQQAAGAAK